MSCCCHTPLSASLGAALFVLFVGVPSAFYNLVEVIFHYDDLDHPVLRILYIVAQLDAVAAAAVGLVGRKMGKTRPEKGVPLLEGTCWAGLSAFLLSLASVVWACVVYAQDSHSTESSVYTIGTILIIATPFILLPPAWMSYEFHALSRQLQGRPALLAPNPSVSGGPYGDVEAAASGDPYAALRGDLAGENMGKDDNVMEKKENVAHSLARSMPFGRSQRRQSRGEYAVPAEQQQRRLSRSRGRREMSESEGESELLSEGSSGEDERRRERKSRVRRSGEY
ncbi:hypothetical protein JCM8547_000070 [Rhodosporidiobolus lusitaniae]